MEKLGLCLLLFFFFFLWAGIAESAATPDPRATNFIRASCRRTRYPALCVQCLSGYANTIQQSERQLAQAALAVSLEKARTATTFVSKLPRIRGIKPREYQAVKDCMDNMGDTVDQLNRSLRELGRTSRVGNQEFMWHMSNVQTWVSAALTDENTCLDGFAGPFMDGNVKASIRNKVVYVAQLTSNALALVNRFAARHKG